MLPQLELLILLALYAHDSSDTRTLLNRLPTGLVAQSPLPEPTIRHTHFTALFSARLLNLYFDKGGCDYTWGAQRTHERNVRALWLWLLRTWSQDTDCAD